MKTKEEILKIMDEYREAGTDVGVDKWSDVNLTEEFPEYAIEIVEDFGGEGQGDNRYTTFQFTCKETEQIFYIKNRGSYDSYNGTQWEYGSTRIVSPILKTITVYE